MASWEKNLPVLLTFMNYPIAIRKQIYPTNLIERTNKEIRKRLRPMNSLPDLNAAEKIVYFTVQNLNETWSKRVADGFIKEKEKLQEMFQEKYDS